MSERECVCVRERECVCVRESVCVVVCAREARKQHDTIHYMTYPAQEASRFMVRTYTGND